MTDDINLDPGKILGKSTISVEPYVKIAGDSTATQIESEIDVKNSKTLSTRNERISDATQKKGLEFLPKNFGDSDGDWKIIESDNLFEVLFLDHNQIISINPEIVKNNFILIEKFWKEKKNLWESGSGQVRKTIEDKYGEKNLNNCIKKLEYAIEQLASIQKINEYYQRLREQRIRIGESKLKSLFKMMFKDEVAEPSEMENIFEEGLELDFSNEEIAIIIKKALDSRKYEPYGIPSGKELKEQLLSVSWMAKFKIDEQIKIDEGKSREIFDNTFAYSIEEIGTILFEDEGQAKEYIKEGLVVNSIDYFNPSKAKQIIEINKSKNSEYLKYLQIVYRLNPQLPYKFDGKKFPDIKELSLALFENPKMGKEHFKQGNIEIWLQECQPENYVKLIKIRDTSPNIDLAYLELLYTFNPELPYSFNNDNYSDIKKLTLALFDNPKIGKVHFEQGNLGIWLKECQPENYKKLINIKVTNKNDDLAFLELLYTYNSELPYRLILNTLNSNLPYGDILIKTQLELCTEIDKNQEGWNAGKRDLFNSSILIWLRTIGKFNIVDKWDKVKEQYVERKDVGLEYFLHLINEKLDYPLLEVKEKSFSFPKIQSGDIVVPSIVLANKTRGLIEGNLTLSKMLDGVTLSSQKFSLNIPARNPTLKVNLTIDSTKLMKGVDYRTDIQLTSSDNKKISIPVSFKLVFPRSAFIKEIIKYALLFGILGGTIRGVWLFFGFKDWMKVNYQYYLSRTDLYWQDKPAIYYFPVIFLILIVLIILIIWNWKKLIGTMDKI